MNHSSTLSHTNGPFPEPGEKARYAAQHLLVHCGGLRRTERVLILHDNETQGIAELFSERCQNAGGVAQLCCLPGTSVHGGGEPPADVAAAMVAANLVVGLTRMSMAHTQARMQANAVGARYLSLPDYSWPLLEHPSLLVDFISREKLVVQMADMFTAGQVVHVSTLLGTDICMRIEGRTGNACPGFVRPGGLGSPPDIEANVAPIEDSANGIVIVDGSIPCPEIGLLSNPVKLKVKNGRIVEIDGQAEQTRILEDMFSRVGAKSRVLAECGVGLNDAASLTGSMLTDEGSLGSVHFGFGSNATIGGVNAVPFHLDFVMRSASLAVDGRQILSNGRLVL